MKKIMHITEHIREEMDDAEKYLKQAAKCKGVDDSMSALAAELAGEELKHAEKWHDHAVREIMSMKEMMKERGEAVPAFMIEMWEEKHEEYIHRMGILKHELELIKR